MQRDLVVSYRNIAVLYKCSDEICALGSLGSILLDIELIPTLRVFASYSCRLSETYTHRLSTIPLRSPVYHPVPKTQIGTTSSYSRTVYAVLDAE